jgi:hypothetical protein
MTLAENLTDSSGRLLLPAGTTLTDKHLRYCQMWGIPEAEIVGNDPAESPEETLNPAAVAAAEARLRPLYRHVDLEHPFISTLFRHCVLVEARRGR